MELIYLHKYTFLTRTSNEYSISYLHDTFMKYTYFSCYEMGTSMGKYTTNHDSILSIILKMKVQKGSNIFFFNTQYWTSNKLDIAYQNYPYFMQINFRCIIYLQCKVQSLLMLAEV